MSGISEEVLFRALGVDDPPPQIRAVRVVQALKTLGVTADRIFDRIKTEIERGDIQSARAHLNFVDELLRE